MPTMTGLLIVLLLSLILGMCLAPFVMRFISSSGLVDKPDGRRKLHGRAVPLAGGFLIVLTTFLSLAISYFIDPVFAANVRSIDVSIPGFMLAILVIFVVGLIDDRFRIQGRIKLAGQVVAILVAIASGVRFDSITILDLRVELGSFGVALTMIWLLGVVNAVNLLDGIDGMVGSIGLIVVSSLAVMAIWAGHNAEAVVAASLAGSLAAFLVFNKPPAKIFLGDSGSMSIGLLLGSLAVVCSLKGPTTVMFALPVTLLLLPILDTFAAITRRVLTGRSIFMTDRGHLHHRLLQSGLSHSAVLTLVVALSLVLSIGVLVSLRFQNDMLAISAALIVSLFLLITRLFGVQELILIRNKVREALGRSASARLAGKVVVIRLQGRAVGWETIWEHLASRAEDFQLHSVSVDINAPLFQESYFIRWTKRTMHCYGTEECIPDLWQLEIPLKIDGQTVGVVRMTGPTGVTNLTAILERIHEFVSDISRLTRAVLVPGIRPIPAHAPLAETSPHPRQSQVLKPDVVGV
jgi:UDP-GlcNAc:undecaprenyl-phosphate GlcNAc-1-phosphate transferase